MRVETEIEIAAPAEKVWVVLADLPRWPEWAPGFELVEQLTSGPLSSGKKLRYRLRPFGLPITVSATVTVYEMRPPWRMELRRRGLVTEKIVYELRRGSGQTIVSRGHTATGWLAWFLAPALKPSASLQSRRLLAALQRCVESPAVDGEHCCNGI